jgi:hypothetical protein
MSNSGERDRRAAKPSPRPGSTPKKAKKPKPPMPPGREARAPRPAGRPAPPPVTLADPSTGRKIVVASWIGTAVLAVTAIAADIAPHPLDIPALVVALALFFGGIVAFMSAYAIAIGRSREDEISLLGVYGLSGSTPAPVKANLFGSLAVEAVVAVVTASTRLYSTLSFGVLGLLWGLGLAGLWGARHGAFPPRAPDRRR